MPKQTKQGWEPSERVLDEAWRGYKEYMRKWAQTRDGDVGGQMGAALIAAVSADPLLSAAKEMQEALEAENALIVSAQELIASYFPPDGISKDALINGLIELFDGPRQRAAQSLARAALAKSRGQ